MVAYSFNLKFTYVLAGWEGTASDSRIMKNAITRPYPLHIPEGKFYLLDAGYMLKSGLITCFRGERYHLKEYSPRNPLRNKRELFNHQHSSLRNAVERAIGVPKKRFPSGTEPTFGVKIQKRIIVCYCILHNYLMGVDPDGNILHEVDVELANQNMVSGE
ncbi:uncharacterized protein LOC119982890 [Tripterygium wilfordii]|uniref:uncharacterized protein LOC119982890 n=1 Tax=Tripterygium wilfordii TaxID=458696 RepID=UPI0018F80644|nr:uncharacterized protein LOC119982890 [Tripterygium wilfordii]